MFDQKLCFRLSPNSNDIRSFEHQIEMCAKFRGTVDNNLCPSLFAHKFSAEPVASEYDGTLRGFYR